jgi:hypothetical protein
MTRQQQQQLNTTSAGSPLIPPRAISVFSQGNILNLIPPTAARKYFYHRARDIDLA